MQWKTKDNRCCKRGVGDTTARVLLPHERGPAREEKVWEMVVKITDPIIEVRLSRWLIG